MNPVSYKNWIIATNLIHWVGLGGTVEVSDGYTSLSQCYICSSHRGVWPPSLFLLVRLTSDSISPLVVVSSSMLNRVTQVGKGRPMGGWVLPLVQGYVVSLHLLQICMWRVRLPPWYMSVPLIQCQVCPLYIFCSTSWIIKTSPNIFHFCLCSVASIYHQGLSHCLCQSVVVCSGLVVRSCVNQPKGHSRYPLWHWCAGEWWCRFLHLLQSLKHCIG